MARCARERYDEPRSCICKGGGSLRIYVKGGVRIWLQFRKAWIQVVWQK